MAKYAIYFTQTHMNTETTFWYLEDTGEVFHTLSDLKADLKKRAEASRPITLPDRLAYQFALSACTVNSQGLCILIDSAFEDLKLFSENENGEYEELAQDYMECDQFYIENAAELYDKKGRSFNSYEPNRRPSMFESSNYAFFPDQLIKERLMFMFNDVQVMPDYVQVPITTTDVTIANPSPIGLDVSGYNVDKKKVNEYALILSVRPNGETAAYKYQNILFHEGFHTYDDVHATAESYLATARYFSRAFGLVAVSCHTMVKDTNGEWIKLAEIFITLPNCAKNKSIVESTILALRKHYPYIPSSKNEGS